MNDLSRRFAQPPAKVRREDLDRLFAADLSVLADLRVGVSTSSFQTEGGIDGSKQPATNWRRWQREGRVERIGPAIDLWRRYDEATARCRAMHLDVFRMSMEWARVAVAAHRVDARVVNGYAKRLAQLETAGIEPIVTLQHFTHPKWLTRDFWLTDRAPAVFAMYVREVVGRLGEALIAHGATPPRRLLTINEPNMLALATYFAGIFPHGAGALAQGDLLGGPRAMRMLDHLLAAHVLAYRAIHAVYAERGWARPDVSLNLCVFDVYGFGRMPFDLLRANERGVARDRLHAHLLTCRDAFYSALCADERSPRTEAALAIDRLFWQFVAPDAFAATLDAVYAEPGPTVDSIAIDIYDPWSFQQARGAESVLAGLAAGEALLSLAERARTGIRLVDPWEWVIEPETFVRVVRSMHDAAVPLPIDVIENGMAQRREPGSAEVSRPDGISRPEFIRGSAFAMAYARAVDRLPLRTYAYWTMVDNYELGRYSPRFGLYGLGDEIDAHHAASWSRHDANGDDAAASLATFASIVRASRREPGSERERLARYLGHHGA